MPVPSLYASTILNRSIFSVTGPKSVQALIEAVNLYTAAQADFSESSNVDLRSNWTVSTGNLQQITGNANTNDVRINFDTPIVSGRPHLARWQTVVGTAGTYKPQYGGDGAVSGNTIQGDDDGALFYWEPAGNITGNYTRFGFNPTSDDLDVQITGVQAYDLSSVDPNTVACDVFLCLGDSNMSCAVSDFVTQANLTTPYDTRVWYMPCLRASSTNAATYSTRHIPQPAIEPVQSATNAQRMSPLQAFGVQIAGWSSARGRPVLLLSLGDAGSGLNGTEDWRKTSAVGTTGSRMYDEMLLLVAAMNALGPAHQIVGAIVSLGANDTTGADYDTVWVPEATQFVSDLRSEASIGNANLPICWITVGEHYEPVGGEDRGARMIAAIESLAHDSGSGNAISGVTTVRPPTGNELGGATDPHFNAAGMQANGVAMANALQAIL